MTGKEETGIFTLYSDVEATAVRWLWYPFIAVGKITLLQGDPGDGKSTMMMNLIAEFARPGIRHMKKCSAVLLFVHPSHFLLSAPSVWSYLCIPHSFVSVHPSIISSASWSSLFKPSAVNVFISLISAAGRSTSQFPA